MIVKILGFLDIITAAIFWLFGIFHFLPKNLVMIFALYLLVKGIVFLISLDIASILDIICAGIIFLSFSFTVPVFVIILVSLFLLQKGVFSLLS